MDYNIVIVCAGAVAVSAAVFYITSQLTLRPQSYDDALAEKRRLALLANGNLNQAHKDAGGGKPYKHKQKEKKVSVHQNNQSQSKRAVQQAIYESQPVTKSKANSAKPVQPVQNPIVDSLGSSPPHEVINGEKTMAPPLQQSVPSSSVTPLPPLKVEPKPVLRSKLSISSTSSTGSAKVHFDAENLSSIDLSKKGKKKKVQDTKKNEPVQKSSPITLHRPLAMNSDTIDGSSHKLHTEPASSTLVTDVIPSSTVDHQQPSVSKQSSPPLKNQSRKGTGKSDQLSGRLSAQSVIESIKSLALSNEEIQLLIDVLLNKQELTPSSKQEWHKKNDPVATLKKQLHERDEELTASNANLQLARLRIQEMRQEVAFEKARTNKLNAAISGLNTQVSARDEQSAQLQRTLVATSQELIAARKEVEHKRHENGRLVAELNAIQNKITALTGQNKAMTEQISTLQAQLHTSRLDVSTAGARIIALEDEVSKLKSIPPPPPPRVPTPPIAVETSHYGTQTFSPQRSVAATSPIIMDKSLSDKPSFDKPKSTEATHESSEFKSPIPSFDKTQDEKGETTQDECEVSPTNHISNATVVSEEHQLTSLNKENGDSELESEVEQKSEEDVKIEEGDVSAVQDVSESKSDIVILSTDVPSLPTNGCNKGENGSHDPDADEDQVTIDEKAEENTTVAIECGQIPTKFTESLAVNNNNNPANGSNGPANGNGLCEPVAE